MPLYFRLKSDPNSKRIVDGLERLRAQLDADFPVKNLEETLILATWNIREFDSEAYGERVADAYYFIAEIVSRFDIIAIQEVRRDLSALKHLVSILGWPWKYTVTDTTEGHPGNNERLAFVYDSRKVHFGGLAGELVLPPVESKVDGKTIYTPVAQIVRTPFTAGFSAGWTNFQLATVHIVYGEDKAESPARVEEIKQVAEFLRDRANEPERWSDNLVLLGDFNIYATTDATMRAITDAGWVIPDALQAIPGSNVPEDKHYDQIAISPKPHWFEPTGHAGVFDYYQSVFRDDERDQYAADMGEAYNVNSKGKPRTEDGKRQYFHTYWRTGDRTFGMPMWIEITIDYSSDYLSDLRPTPAAPLDPHV